MFRGGMGGVGVLNILYFRIMKNAGAPSCTHIQFKLGEVKHTQCIGVEVNNFYTHINATYLMKCIPNTNNMCKYR